LDTYGRQSDQLVTSDTQVNNEGGRCLRREASGHPTLDYISDFSGSMVARLIESEAALDLLEEPWSQLASAAGAGPFQSFCWAQAWVRTIGRSQGRQLRIATAWDGSRLLAIFPLTRRRYMGVRLLEWIGARVTDYCDVLVHPTVNTSSALLTLWSALRARGDCDVIRLVQVRTDAHVNALFQPARLNPWVETNEQTYYLSIKWGSGEQWLDEQSAHARKEIRRDLRRLANAGFEYYVWKSPDSYEPVIEAIITQKSAWLARKGLGVLLGHREGPQFLRKCIAALAARGTLHLSGFRSNQGFAACHLGFYQHGVLYGYMLTYDFACASYSPGAATRSALIMWACDHGIRRIDLLRGSDEYKLRYQPERQPLQTLVMPRGIVGGAYVSAYCYCQHQKRRLGRALSSTD
jgi:CelD/BcsL family acetyltransferase involved in cellulose biosynthesis